MTDQLTAVITAFLEVNPTPTDEQVHSFAHALNIDKEELESAMFELLADYSNEDELIEPTDLHGLEIAASATDVLDGDYDPSVTPPELLMLNDGDPTADDNYQDELYNDGELVDEADDNQELLHDDGAPDMSN